MGSLKTKDLVFFYDKNVRSKAMSIPQYICFLEKNNFYTIILL